MLSHVRAVHGSMCIPGVPTNQAYLRLSALNHDSLLVQCTDQKFTQRASGGSCSGMFTATSYLKSKGLSRNCALITDGRFSGGSSGLSIGHISPEAAQGGTIALVENGDRIAIDIPNRSIALLVDDATLDAGALRWICKAGKAGPSVPRKRKVTTALRAYAALTTSAARGAVRVVG